VVVLLEKSLRRCQAWLKPSVLFRNLVRLPRRCPDSLAVFMVSGGGKKQAADAREPEWLPGTGPIKTNLFS
jgi:hypothetical protein